MDRIVILAKDFDEASVSQLTDNLVKEGVSIVEYAKDIGAFLGDYAGELDRLKRLPNVEDVAPEGRLNPSVFEKRLG